MLKKNLFGLEFKIFGLLMLKKNLFGLEFKIFGLSGFVIEVFFSAEGGGGFWNAKNKKK